MIPCPWITMNAENLGPGGGRFFSLILHRVPKGLKPAAGLVPLCSAQCRVFTLQRYRVNDSGLVGCVEALYIRSCLRMM